MKQRPTRADVANQAGVSKTTVTYVLGDRQDIAIPERTRERVRTVARQLGYHPHAAAQALASGRTNSITVAFPVRIGPYYARVLQAFERYTNAHGYHMIASTIGHVSIENVLPDLWSLLNNLTDGVILVDMPGTFKPYIDETLPSSKPIVSMGIFTVPGIDSVEVALAKGAIAALDHLMASNPRRFAFFGSHSQDNDSAVLERIYQNSHDPRFLSYCRLMERLGRPLEVINGNLTNRHESMAAMRAHLSEYGCPDAIFCFNDEIAICAHRVLREMGFRIPENVRLVGCDGSEEGEYVEPQLSTIAQPVERMCALAWEVMTNRLNDPHRPPQHIIVDTELIVRGSSLRSSNSAQLIMIPIRFTVCLLSPNTSRAILRPPERETHAKKRFYTD